jgi:hypothetical protein
VFFANIRKCFGRNILKRMLLSWHRIRPIAGFCKNGEWNFGHQTIRMDLGEVGWGDVDWIGLAKDRNRWSALVDSVLNLRVT